MDQINQIKQSLNITDIVGSYVELKRAGKNYKGNCPFHSEDTPSFMVSPELQIYKCFGCGKSGDMFSFIQEIEGIEFVNALEQLAEKAGVKLEKAVYDPNSEKKALIYEINEVVTKFYSYMLLKHPSGRPGLEYFTKKRGLSEKTLQEFRLGFASKEWDLLFQYLTKKGYRPEDLELAGVAVKRRSGDGYFDKFRGRVMFPFISDRGKIVGFTGRSIYEQDPKYLNTQETLVFHKNSYIYGLEQSKVGIKARGAVFVEGQMDVISAHQAGMNNAIATSGTALTVNQLKILSRFTQDITFCFDSDTAGQAAIDRSIDLAEQENFNMKVALIPEKYKDLDELIKSDTDAAKAVLRDAVSIYDFYFSLALKNNDVKTPIGKKKFVEEIAPKYAKIKNKVILDHYVKKISDEIDINEDTVASIINEIGTKESGKALEKAFKENDQVVMSSVKRSTEDYILALLFNCELELAQNILYKLGKNDFTNEQNLGIFSEFKEYVIGRKRQFDIKYFISKLDDSLRSGSEEIYLTDLGDLTEETKLFEKELNQTFKRLKSETISRELADIKEKIRKAELVNNFDEIQKMSEEVLRLSKLKKQYEL